MESKFILNLFLSSCFFVFNIEWKICTSYYDTNKRIETLKFSFSSTSLLRTAAKRERHDPQPHTIFNPNFRLQAMKSIFIKWNFFLCFFLWVCPTSHTLHAWCKFSEYFVGFAVCLFSHEFKIRSFCSASEGFSFVKIFFQEYDGGKFEMCRVEFR